MTTRSFITGSGDPDKLRLIEESFAMLCDSPTLPNLRMLYKSSSDMLSEGFIWGDGWWIQNSFGFTMGAIPLLDPFWSLILQNSYDAFWERIGDGRRIGADNGVPTHPNYGYRAPDGSLGDCVMPGVGIVYRQGDGDVDSYDWFYEATAAGVLMEAEILLFDRRPERIKKYLPLMRRSLDHIESTRAENGLFLVGPSANLLAPSYGGSPADENGKPGKGYLMGLSVTTAAALKKCAALCRMVGDAGTAEEYERRLTCTLDALPQLLTEEGYFVKSMDPDGTKHGVYGADRYGYLEGVCNADAVAWGVVSPEISRSICEKIASVPGIRPAGILCNNYPHLDDTLDSYRKHTSEPHSLGWRSGDWVDGGCWATVEGRAILAYLKTGQYEDAFRAAGVYMKWAEEYRQDAPMSEWGFNTNNPWQQENDDHSVCRRPVSVMVDNFAPVTCLLRGLFGWDADAEGLLARPQIPEDIFTLKQHVPVTFGGCKVYAAYTGGNGPLRAFLDGESLAVNTDRTVRIPAELLPRGGEVCLTLDRSGAASLMKVGDLKRDSAPTGDVAGLPEDLAAIYGECAAALEAGTDPLRAAHLKEILSAAETAALRRRLPFDRHELRPMTEEKTAQILNLYDQTVRELYKGLKYRI
ncbi:MAG: hypothetical protein IK082_05830 [Oscillospiraceae bacterium]|nr:hypothetical protein [Oscillospiraceae bacterium]